MQKYKNNTIVGNQTLLGMLNGISIVAGAIRPTYGGGGVNAVIEREIYPFHEIVNDAQAIIQSIHVSDPLEKRGVNFLKELSDKANKDSGDGRKTTCILAEEILRGGYEANTNGNQLKKELYDLIPFIEKEIDEQKKSIDINNVKDVATIAGESEEIGSLIQEIYLKIGKEGVIHVEGSGTYETYYEFIDAVRFGNGTGFISDSMVHDEEDNKDGKVQTKAVYKKPLILVTKRKITKESEIEPLLGITKREGRDLVIMADDMDSKIVSLLIDLHRSKVMNICIIKPSVLWKNYVFEDFAKCVGATIVSDEEGVDFKNLGLSHLGTCDKIVIDENKVDLMGTADISGHLAQLKLKGDNDSLLRIQWLNTKTAIIKLGAGSESELSYKRLKTQDAVNSTKLALEDGVVRGGGITLANITKDLPSTEAGKILYKALKAPFNQIALNSGFKGDVYTSKEIAENVIDASRVIKNAIRNAINLAGIILTTGVVVNLPEESFEDKQLRLLAGKRSPF